MFDLKIPTWLAVGAGADTVRLVPCTGSGPDVFCKALDVQAAIAQTAALERERLAREAESQEDSAGFHSLSAAEIRAGGLGLDAQVAMAQSIASEPGAEALLRHLLTKHFYVDISGSLAWTYKEGNNLRDVDTAAFEKALVPYLKPDDAVELMHAHKARGL